MNWLERSEYLLGKGWTFSVSPYCPETRRRWHKRGMDISTLLGAFMRQQAADARAEREAELADMQNLQEGK